MSNNSDKLSRRSAIKAAGIAVTGAAVGAVSATAAMSNQSNKPLAGQVALVTGGARGIGLACAIRLASEGADIALCDIAEQIPSVPYPMATEEELNDAVKEIIKLGVRCEPYKVDIRDKDAVQQMTESIKGRFGRLDVLIANAGIGIMESFEAAIDGASWKDVIDVNIHGTAHCIRYCIPLMKEQQYGRIVTISSQLGRKGSSGATAYVASKWAMIGLTKSIALEVGKDGITCNCVCPSATDTGMLNNKEMLSKLSSDNPTIEGFSEKLKSMSPIPVGVVSADRVADLVELLSLPKSGHLSGTVLDVAASESSQNLG